MTSSDEDFEFNGNSMFRCKFCGKEIPSGIFNISGHWIECVGSEFHKSLIESAETGNHRKLLKVNHIAVNRRLIPHEFPDVGKFEREWMEKNPVPNIASLIKDAYDTTMEKVLTEVMVKVLDRKPTIDDWKECSRFVHDDYPNKFFFKYKNISLGWVRTKWDGARCTVTFDPHTGKPGDTISFEE